MVGFDTVEDVPVVHVDALTAESGPTNPLEDEELVLLQPTPARMAEVSFPLIILDEHAAPVSLQPAPVRMASVSLPSLAFNEHEASVSLQQAPARMASVPLPTLIINEHE